MTRPLLGKTAEELYAAVDRNKRDRAELLLVLHELRFPRNGKRPSCRGARQAAPRLHGNQMMIARSEYQGRVEATGEHFISHDVHAAVREVARRAQAAAETAA